MYVATGLFNLGILLTTPGEPVPTCNDAQHKYLSKPLHFQILWRGCLWHFTYVLSQDWCKQSRGHPGFRIRIQAKHTRTPLKNVCCCIFTTMQRTCQYQPRTWRVAKHWRANTTRTSCSWLWGWMWEVEWNSKLGQLNKERHANYTHTRVHTHTQVEYIRSGTVDSKMNTLSTDTSRCFGSLLQTTVQMNMY